MPPKRNFISQFWEATTFLETMSVVPQGVFPEVNTLSLIFKSWEYSYRLNYDSFAQFTC